jgi:predicted metal-dependent HD superfamily phosphohydrolase
LAALWNRLGALSDPAVVYALIAAAYGEPHRHYHTLEHIGRILALFHAVRGRVRAPDPAELALWLHDVVYDPRATDNEEKSAQFARQTLQAGAVSPEVAELTAGMILATKHAAPPEDPDACYVVDVDLSILGAPPEEFNRYEAQIREEQSFRPDEEFRQRRAHRLRAFLDCPRIFLTPEFASYEAPARANLARSLKRLGDLDPLPPHPTHNPLTLILSPLTLPLPWGERRRGEEDLSGAG